jgi:hypothetical protein
MRSCFVALKPWAWTLRQYVACGSREKEYRPDASVTNCDAIPVLVLTSLTVASCTAAPAGSETIPKIEVVETKDWVDKTVQKANPANEARRVLVFLAKCRTFKEAFFSRAKRGWLW